MEVELNLRQLMQEKSSFAMEDLRIKGKRKIERKYINGWT